MPYTRNANLSAGQKAVNVLGIVLLFAAISCFIIGDYNLRLANRTKPTIHILTAAELIANGPGDNAYVRIEQATPLVSLYVVHRDSSGNEHWSTAYIPLAPANASSADQAAPRIILRTQSLGSKADLAKLNAAVSFEGIVYNGVRSLTPSAQNLLKSRFPDADFANCYLVQHNSQPSSKPGTIMTLGVGSFLALGALGLWIRSSILPVLRG
jgi:hypothetical protein